MYRSLWGIVVVISLAALCLAVLPIAPVRETASATLDPNVARQESRLLGENGATMSDPSQAPQEQASGGGGAMTLSVPKLGLKDVAVPTGSSQEDLDQEGVLHVAGSGSPWQEGSNTFIAGHALGFMRTRVPYAFYELDKLNPGDEVVIKDQNGEPYTFRVFDRMTVRPEDYWVTYPSDDGRTLVSLQTCTPAPTFENRLIVRGELVS